MSRVRAASAALLALCALAAGVASAAPVTRTPRATAAERAHRRAAEAAFLRTVDRNNTANVVTGDLERYAGTHIAYDCNVDRVVEPGLILGECGSSAEPLDLFIHLPTAGLRERERLQILGIMERPAMWTDITGHTVYYAFIKAVFVDRES